MAWERRERGGLYYTRSRRVGGRVVREYVGCGVRGQVAAMRDAEDRQAQLDARQERRREHEQPEAVLDALRSFGAAVDELVVHTLEASGHHRHRGEWRRRREP